jgi:hypothetical protein
VSDYSLDLFLAVQAERIRLMGWQRPRSAARPEAPQPDVLLWTDPERRERGRKSDRTRRAFLRAATRARHGIVLDLSAVKARRERQRQYSRQWHEMRKGGAA